VNGLKALSKGNPPGDNDQKQLLIFKWGIGKQCRNIFQTLFCIKLWKYGKEKQF
jgi:hypothetical protein